MLDRAISCLSRAADQVPSVEDSLAACTYCDSHILFSFHYLMRAHAALLAAQSDHLGELGDDDAQGDVVEAPDAAAELGDAAAKGGGA